MQTLIGVWVFIVGACIGSFLNVVIIRGLKNEQIVRGPSHCTTCDYVLKWYDNIPIISYIMLGGRCRSCHKHISLQYPIVESITAVTWLLLYIEYGIQVKTALYMVACASMIVIAVVDLKIQEIPSTHQLIIFICGVLNLVFKGLPMKEAFTGFLTVPVFLIIVYIFCLFVLKVEAIGIGDIKLEAVIGLLLGLKLSVTELFILGVF